MFSSPREIPQTHLPVELLFRSRVAVICCCTACRLQTFSVRNSIFICKINGAFCNLVSRKFCLQRFDVTNWCLDLAGFFFYLIDSGFQLISETSKFWMVIKKCLGFIVLVFTVNVIGLGQKCVSLLMRDRSCGPGGNSEKFEVNFGYSLWCVWVRGKVVIDINSARISLGKTDQELSIIQCGMINAHKWCG